MLISVVILTKNEGENIQRCLEALQWTDERIVIDDLSIDKTASIAKRCSAKVFVHALQDDFSEQRNYGLEKTKGEWVMFVDADEVVSAALRDEILSNIKKEHILSGFSVKRTDILWGKELKHGEWGKQMLIRLGRKGAGRWVGAVHERWEISGQLGVFYNSLFHYPHYSVEEFIREVNYYTDLRARELFEQKKHVSAFDIILYPRLKFIYNYFLRFGFMDGMEGFLIAIIMSFHSFLVRAKLWLLWQEKK